MLDTFSQSRVLVIGDVMLDSYVVGEVERVSPEAPVPVLRFVSRRSVPGGAANVAANITSLGARGTLLAAIGSDETGRLLRGLLDECGVVADLIEIEGRPTTCKTRLMAGTHQVVRLDEEETSPIDEACRDALLERLEALAPEHDIIILSDYRKGMLIDPIIQAILTRAGELGIPTIVDPKRNDWSIYRGASVITPNRAELELATGQPCVEEDEAAQAASLAIARTGARILLTRSEKGMALFADGQGPVFMPTSAQEVFDVSGAGDTVVACLAAGMGAGLPMEEAMAIANIAAGIVVSKVGTATVSSEELRLAHEQTRMEERSVQGGLLSRSDAADLRRRWGAAQKVVGFTNGCFDLLHPGHISLLEQAAQQCDHLIVGINADASVARLKGPSRPIQTEVNRARVLSALACVSAVTIFDEDTPLELLEELRPDVLVKGSDYTIDKVVGADLLRSYGGRVFLADLVQGQSTSNLVMRSKEPEQQAAAE